MRRAIGLLLAGALAVGLGGAAQAGTLPYKGTVSLELGTLPPIPVTGTGVATVNGSGGTGHLSQLHLDQGIQTTNTIIVPITDPAVTGEGILSLRATAITVNSTAQVTFAHTLGSLDVVTDAGGGGGVLPVSGTVLVCILKAGCGINLPVPLTVNATRGVGIGGGIITVSGFAQGGLRLSIQANPWTVNTAAVTGIPNANGFGSFTSTRKGFVHGPASGTSSTATPGGVVQLVTPVLVNTKGAGAGNETLALFGTLKIQFVPEPGTLLLLGSGVAGLALLGRRRMQK